jgi:hypothetical protein
MNKIIKKLGFIVLLLLSPLASVVVIGAAYIMVRMVNGLEFLAAFSSLKEFIHSIRPYFLYLTLIPAVLFVLVQIIKYKIKSKKKFYK